MENTHPFIRELWGKYWTFAHNGQLTGIKKDLKKWLDNNGTGFRPVGTTDSEAAFCHLLNQLNKTFTDFPKNQRPIWEFISRFCREVSKKGVFNVLLSNGDNLFCYCSKKLYWITRKAPFGFATLKDADITIDFTKKTKKEDIISVIASDPLTADEKWEKVMPQTGILFNNGEIVNHYK